MTSEEIFLAGRLAGILECAAAVQMGKSASAATKVLIAQQKGDAAFRVWAQSRIQQALKARRAENAALRPDRLIKAARVVPLVFEHIERS